MALIVVFAFFLTDPHPLELELEVLKGVSSAVPLFSPKRLLVLALEGVHIREGMDEEGEDTFIDLSPLCVTLGDVDPSRRSENFKVLGWECFFTAGIPVTRSLLRLLLSVASLLLVGS